MLRRRSLSPPLIRVLRALAADPTRWRYGYDLSTDTGLKSGSLYRLLVRLADRGLLETSWESPVPGKPPRHLYRLTTAGLAAVPTGAPDRPTARRQRQLREA